MFIKVYWGSWAALVLAGLLLFAMGSLSWLALTVMGAVACTLIFTGMMCITPTLVGPHAKEFQHSDAEPVVEKAKTEKSSSRVFSPARVQSRHAH